MKGKERAELRDELTLSLSHKAAPLRQEPMADSCQCMAKTTTIWLSN